MTTLITHTQHAFKSHHKIQWLESPEHHITLKHGFFARTGGASAEPYASLNCGWNRGEAAHVHENYTRIGAIFKVTAEHHVLRLNQVHSTDVLVVDKPWPLHERPTGDGLVTRHSGLVIGVITADCVPVLLVDPTVPVIGAIHAGWRGTVQGIIDQAMKTMMSQGARLECIHALVGPAIQQKSYEVGQEVRMSFAEAIQTRFFQPVRPDHFLFDLPGTVIHQLQTYPLHAIEYFNCDTYAQPDLFFSCRRAAHEDQLFGNQFSGIMI